MYLVNGWLANILAFAMRSILYQYLRCFADLESFFAQVEGTITGDYIRPAATQPAKSSTSTAPSAASTFKPPGAPAGSRAERSDDRDTERKRQRTGLTGSTGWKRIQFVDLFSILLILLILSMCFVVL